MNSGIVHLDDHGADSMEIDYDHGSKRQAVTPIIAFVSLTEAQIIPKNPKILYPYLTSLCDESVFDLGHTYVNPVDAAIAAGLRKFAMKPAGGERALQNRPDPETSFTNFFKCVAHKYDLFPIKKFLNFEKVDQQYDTHLSLSHFLKPQEDLRVPFAPSYLNTFF